MCFNSVCGADVRLLKEELWATAVKKKRKTKQRSVETFVARFLKSSFYFITSGLPAPKLSWLYFVA